MIKVGVTQRVEIVSAHGERRDCLDQNWSRFLCSCGMLPVLLPNVPELAMALCSAESISGLLLTGGNDLAALGGDAPERDATEHALVEMAEASSVPVIGVCRGMQLLQSRFGVRLQKVAGHVMARQTIRINGQPAVVNSYHNYAALESHSPLEIWAVSGDGVVKAVRHATAAMVGIMWHPERLSPFSAFDIDLFREVFKVKECVL